MSSIVNTARTMCIAPIGKPAFPEQLELGRVLATQVIDAIRGGEEPADLLKFATFCVPTIAGTVTNSPEHITLLTGFFAELQEAIKETQ